jgi:hypothetical protein
MDSSEIQQSAFNKFLSDNVVKFFFNVWRGCFFRLSTINIKIFSYLYEISY